MTKLRRQGEFAAHPGCRGALPYDGGVVALIALVARVLVVFASSNAIVSAQTEPLRPPVLGRLVDVDGRSVHIYCTGQGSPTVVVTSGGFSFDWGLVQPNIARITRICTYDPAGTAWSDRVPEQLNPNCTDRVNELHKLLGNAAVNGPYVLVGFSIGGLVARLYAIRHPGEISGIVLADHTFIEADDAKTSPARPSAPVVGLDSPPVLIFKTPISLDLEDDQNFAKLPERDRDLHRWALSIHSLRPTPEMAAVCFSEVDAAERNVSFPFGRKPLAVVSTLYDSARYRELQHQLLMLSHTSKQFVAQNSSHMVIIDEPEMVIQAIKKVIMMAAAQENEAKPGR
jgi:pimeloyl-ACP methyl ester carboxylesterase